MDAETDSEAGLARTREVRATMARTIPPPKYVIREADSLPLANRSLIRQYWKGTLSS